MSSKSNTDCELLKNLYEQILFYDNFKTMNDMQEPAPIFHGELLTFLVIFLYKKVPGDVFITTLSYDSHNSRVTEEKQHEINFSGFS